MVTFLFTSVFVLGLLAIAIYFWQKPANSRKLLTCLRRQKNHGDLFSDFRVNQLRPPTNDQFRKKAPK